MSAPDLLRRREVAAVRDLELAARAALAGLRHGVHATPLLGAGAEVWGLRPYRQGDDAGQVDWKRSARGDRLYTRLRADTSSTQAILVVDASRSMGVGHASGGESKLDVARTAAAALALLLVEQGDTVGLLASTAPDVAWRPPAGGAFQGHVLLDVLAGIEANGAVPPSELVALAMARVRRPSLLVVISDGWDDEAYADALRRAAAAGHDVTALHVSAPGDRALPSSGAVELEDAETGERLVVDASALGPEFAAAAIAFHDARDLQLRGPRLHSARLLADSPLVPQLRAFLTARQRSRG